MPELVVRGWRRLLHNQRALYMKRLLLFEPRVDPRPVYQLLMRCRPPQRSAGRRAASPGARLVRYRSIVVPLLEPDETEHALDLACRLAADRGARVVLVAPLVVP